MPFLLKMLLPKLSSMYLENALFTIMALRTLLLLAKELTSQPEQLDCGPGIMKSTGFAVSPTILKQLS